MAANGSGARWRDSEVLTVCFLCSKPLDLEDVSGEHVLQKQFIKRNQPKKKGYAYAGKIDSHLSCNNGFGGKSGQTEAYCQTALKVLEVFLDGKPRRFQNVSSPEITFQVTTSIDLDLSKDECEFFGIIDARGIDYREFKDDSFYEGKKRINPFVKPLNVVLSVLAKSSAAFLLKKGIIQMQPHWRILAATLNDPDRTFDAETFFGKTDPYEVGLNVWPKACDNGDGLVLFRVSRFFVFFLVATSRDRSIWDAMAELAHPTNRFVFNGKTLMELIGYEWTRRAF